MRSALAAAVCLGLVGVGAPVPAAAQYHMEDTLRGGTSGNALGGSFSPDGWTVTGEDDRIWWAVPRLVSGYVELTLTNATLSNLTAADGEIFAMYEAGHGITEPIGYNPELRNNHYKAFIRVYGTEEVGREGSMKLIWIMCPSGAPGYSTDTEPCGCESFLEEPFADPGGWDGSAQRIRLEWGDGVSRLLRNGTEVVSVDWSDSGIAFGPHELHLMLGNPRNGAVGGASMPIGAVFSDLVVDGVEGEVAVCGGTVDGGVPMADAGVPADAGAPPDAGVEDGTTEDGGALDSSRPGMDAGARGPGGSTGGVESGCGCRVSAPRGGSGASFAALALLVAIARRRIWPRAPGP